MVPIFVIQQVIDWLCMMYGRYKSLAGWLSDWLSQTKLRNTADLNIQEKFQTCVKS